jgi:hypothetical protein
MGELIILVAIGIVCAVVGFTANAVIRHRARKRQIVKRISQIPFWDMDK